MTISNFRGKDKKRMLLIAGSLAGIGLILALAAIIAGVRFLGPVVLDTVDWIVQNENEAKGCLLVFVGIPCFIIIMFRKRKREKERKKQK